MFPLGPRDVVEGEKFKPTGSWNPLEQPAFSKPAQEFKDALRNLYHLTGFPEPFLAGRKDFYRRWRDEHLSLLATEEIRDLSKISDLVRLQTLAFLLPERVGSILSINNLAQALSCAHVTVSTWLDALEQVHMIFKVPPYIGKLSRAIRKEKKVYFWDWGVVEDEGKRTKDGRETDFLITRDQKALILVEAKLSGTNPDDSLRFFRRSSRCPWPFRSSGQRISCAR
jgi:predicted AAA+ superfamily ATPase